MRKRAGKARISDSDVSDRGESLVELLVSIAIMGIAVVAILGALSMSSSASSLHRGQAQAQNLLRNWAEQVSGATYVDCATPSDIPALGVAGFTGSVTSVKYWSLSTLSFASSCGTDSGIQRVALKVSAPSSMGNFDQTLEVIRRKACASSC